MTVVYLIRHSEPLKDQKGILDINESILLSNVKNPLSVDGEKLAERISNNKEFLNIDVIWSSDYVRTISTAKYFAYNNNIKVNISDKLGERKYGINSWSELPEDFEKKQFLDENYKIGAGESKKETQEREYKFLMNLLKEHDGKRILIVGHSIAFAFLLSSWCQVSYDDGYYFNDKPFFDGKWNYCEIFKLEFEGNKLINIENIKY